MPYGRGHSRADLAAGERRDDGNTKYVVTDDRGNKYTVTGEKNAKVVAGKTGTYQQK